MPFHVEVRSTVDCARVLNMEETELRGGILEPWVGGLSFEFAGRDWQPRESRLTILEGPALEPGFGGEDGWTNAFRAAEDVTRRMLEAAEASAPAQMAIEVDADSVEAAVGELNAGRSPRQISWSRAVERISARDPDLAAVILVVKAPRAGRPQL